MRILVTGGAGFIGSHLCDRLMTDGHEVICLDNFFTGRKKNVAKWLGNPNFELIRHDVTSPIMLEVDQIYHLACPASPVHYQYNAIKTIKTNFFGTMHMLGLAKRTKATLLIASTSEIYGDPLEHPQVETYWGNVNPFGIRSCYDQGKRIAESLCSEYHRMNGVDIRIPRIFNTYGPNMIEDDGRVVSNFIVQALRGHDLTIYGEGEQTRSFQYVSDLVEGLVRLMNSPCTTPVNLGNPNEFTIRALAELVREMVNPQCKIIQMPLPQDDPTKRQPNICKAKEVLDGWEPKVQLREGLAKTIEYFRSTIDHKRGASEGVAPSNKRIRE